MKCKNCKVELASYLNRCPLCNEKVKKIDNNNPYSDEIEDFSTGLNILYFSRLIIKLLLAANIITMICNLCINKTISWSLYSLFGSLYFCSFYLFFIINKKTSLIINVICLEALLFVIALLSHTLAWFIYLVGPIILLVLIFVLLNIYLSKHTNILRNTSCLLMYIALFLYLLNGLISLFKYRQYILSWSLIANIPIVIVSSISLLLSFNKRIVEEVEKRFFI